MYYDLDVKETKRWILLIIMIIILLISVHFLLISGISCVDKNGCIRSYCDKSWLNKDYKAIVT